MNDEIWKDIKGYEGLYQVSNYGRVKSLARFVNGKGNGKKPIPEIIMKLYKLKTGYLNVILNKKNFLVHRLVAQEFLDNSNNFKMVNHLNGKKEDNYIKNLEWINGSNNNLHAYKTGLSGTGEKHGRHILTEKEVTEIRKLKGKMKYREIGKLYGVHNTTISCIYNNKSWTYFQ